jgi:hypothetical protein
MQSREPVCLLVCFNLRLSRQQNGKCEGRISCSAQPSSGQPEAEWMGYICVALEPAGVA